MWGGLYGLSKIRIRGRWNPYLYNNDQGYSLKRTTNESDMCTDLGVEKIKDLEKNVDYVEIYIPCEENIGYAYIKTEIDKLKYDENEEQNGVLITRNEKPVKVWYQDKEENKQRIYIYNREYFKDEFRNNMESVELQVNNFENFKLSILNAEEYQEEKSWRDKPGYVTDTYIDTLNRVMEIAPKGNTEGLVDFLRNETFPGFPKNQEYVDENWKYYYRYYYIVNRIVHVTIIFTNQKTLRYNYDENNGITILTEDYRRVQDSSDVILEGFKYMFEIEDEDYKHPIYKRTGKSYQYKTHEINWFLSNATTNTILADTNINWIVNGEQLEDKLVKIVQQKKDDYGEYLYEPIHEYQWQNCNISVISSSNNFNNIAVDDDINICYHTLDFNSNKRLLFFDDTNYWQSSRVLSTEVSCRVTDVNGDEQILKRKIPLGKFYIVEDENLVTSTISNFINHINSDIEDRKILDKFESLTAKKRFAIDVDKNLNSYNLSLLPEYAKTKMNVFFDPNTMRPYEANDYYFTKLNGQTLDKGNYRIINEGEEYYKWSRTIADAGTSVGQTVNINKDNFPFNFKLIGETYIRNRYGEDYHYQIELYNCAILDNININLASAGEPTVVNIKMKALTDQGGDIGRLTIYRHQNTRINPRTGTVETTNNSDDILLRKKKLKKVLRAAAQNRSESDIDIVVNNLIKDKDQQKKYVPLDVLERVPILPIEDKYEIRILHPEENTIFCLEHDCAVPIVQEVDYTYLRLIVPDNEDWKDKNYEDYYREIKNTLEKEDLLIAKVDSKGIIRGFVGNKDLEIEPYFSN